ncbi:hypothetical protein F751_5066 [Auxenochlorella protothecoides]|uniref:Uncharacterized protein n=1 Tax=Auxenochlorella protothecoides TaxID=3075 RepID=A0A087SES0_AUXPR|nr:hypothetical protein F751_5066 [Auxenochlorella protothecoides]KFM24224.1 hypothetical protein F751_5066 [Auxenochlorella protothecoides]
MRWRPPPLSGWRATAWRRPRAPPRLTPGQSRNHAWSKGGRVWVWSISTRPCGRTSAGTMCARCEICTHSNRQIGPRQGGCMERPKHCLWSELVS